MKMNDNGSIEGKSISTARITNNALKSPRTFDMLSKNGKSQFVYNTKDSSFLQIDKIMSNKIKNIKAAVQ